MRPFKILLFIGEVMVALALLCIILPGRIALGDSQLRWPTLSKVLEIDNPKQTDSLVNEQEADTIAEFPVFVAEKEDRKPVVAKPKPTIPKVQVDSTTDSRIFLRAFYKSLSQSNNRMIRVLHYGDSQIEEDRITMQIRSALQNRYGGRGVGLMPLAQTIPSLSVKQRLYMNGRYVNPNQGPQRYFVYGFKRDQRSDGKYGPMGQMAVMDNELAEGSENIVTICTPQESANRYTQWQVFADSTIQYSFAGDTVYLRGKGNVYGLSQVSRTGVIVDNIAMRGCLGTVFTKMDSSLLASFYQEQNVRLIIMQFGGNAIPSNRNHSTIRSIVYGLRDQVRYMQSLAPNASILFIGPSDMLTMEDGEWITYPMVPYMDKLLRKMALEENIAYFSLFQFMGGAGGMKRWQEMGIAGSDGVHFNRSGARKAGNAIANWILEGAEK